MSSATTATAVTDGASKAPAPAPITTNVDKAAIVSNIDRFLGGAKGYHQHRPSVPRGVIPLVLKYVDAAQHDLKAATATASAVRTIVDVGCGSGLSTEVWIGDGRNVIGIEPNADMRSVANSKIKAERKGEAINFQAGTSTATGLSDGVADVVQISQALHWMDPAPTFAEVARILKPGGVFVAIDADWPPHGLGMAAEQLFDKYLNSIDQLNAKKGWTAGVVKFAKASHLQRMTDSKQFRWTREIVYHSVEKTNDSVARFVGLCESFGDVQTAVRCGATADELGLAQLKADAVKAFAGAKAGEPQDWYFGYRLRIGIK